MNRILFLPALGLAIGLDRDSATMTNELAFDASQFAASCNVDAKAGAWLWEGWIVCDHPANEVRYDGVVRRASNDEIALLGSVIPAESGTTVFREIFA